MNVFEELIARLKHQYRSERDLVCRSARPLERSGFWTFSIVFQDDFLVSIAWNRHHGFMLTTGFDVEFGGAYDEIFHDAEAVFRRIVAHVKKREATDFQVEVGLSELCKLQGLTQTELASRVEITKGGLSQIESEEDLLGMKVGTIKKLIDQLGGRLVLTAKFPNGDERNLSISA
jgi:Helix-turn-helix